MSWPLGYFTVGSVTWTLEISHWLPSLTIPSGCHVSACRRTAPTSFQGVSRVTWPNSRTILVPWAAGRPETAAFAAAAAGTLSTAEAKATATAAAKRDPRMSGSMTAAMVAPEGATVLPMTNPPPALSERERVGLRAGGEEGDPQRAV